MYESDDRFVILDLETMEAEGVDVNMLGGIDTGCVMPEEMMELLCGSDSPFFIDEKGRKTKDTKVELECEMVFFLLSAPMNLDRALVGTVYWHLPRRREHILYSDFEEQTGWKRRYFIRRIGDVFLFLE